MGRIKKTSISQHGSQEARSQDRVRLGRGTNHVGFNVIDNNINVIQFAGSYKSRGFDHRLNRSLALIYSREIYFYVYIYKTWKKSINIICGATISRPRHIRSHCDCAKAYPIPTAYLQLEGIVLVGYGESAECETK